MPTSFTKPIVSVSVSYLSVTTPLHGLNERRTVVVSFSQAVWRYPDVLAVDKLYTNDIHAVADTYGIEAAAQVIKKVTASRLSYV